VDGSNRRVTFLKGLIAILRLLNSTSAIAGTDIKCFLFLSLYDMTGPDFPPKLLSGTANSLLSFYFGLEV
jgi:hypothetical protein